MPPLCWNREAFHDAALLVSYEVGAPAFISCLPPDGPRRHVLTFAKVPARSTCFGSFVQDEIKVLGRVDLLASIMWSCMVCDWQPSASARLGHDKLAKFLAHCPWAEEYLTSKPQRPTEAPKKADGDNGTNFSEPWEVKAEHETWTHSSLRDNADEFASSQRRRKAAPRHGVRDTA